MLDTLNLIHLESWWQQGQSNKAEQLEVEVLELQKKVLGAKHPDTISAIASLTKMNRKHTCLNQERVVLSSAPKSTQQPITKTSHNRLQRWGQKLTRLGKPKKLQRKFQVQENIPEVDMVDSTLLR